jgi:hypothetical protein
LTFMIRPSRRRGTAGLIEVFRARREALYFCNQG